MTVVIVEEVAEPRAGTGAVAEEVEGRRGRGSESGIGEEEEHVGMGDGGVCAGPAVCVCMYVSSVSVLMHSPKNL